MIIALALTDQEIVLKVEDDFKDSERAHWLRGAVSVANKFLSDDPLDFEHVHTKFLEAIEEECFDFDFTGSDEPPEMFSEDADNFTDPRWVVGSDE